MFFYRLIFFSGYRRSGRQFEEDETYHIQQQQPQFGTTQGKSLNSKIRFTTSPTFMRQAWW